MFVNRGGASASTSCLKASPALPRRRASRGPRLGARDSGLRRPLRTRDRLGRAGRGAQAAEGSGREAAITGDLVAPQMSEVEETTIVEDGASRIIFRIGGLIDVREVEELTEKVGGRSYPPPPALALSAPEEPPADARFSPSSPFPPKNNDNDNKVGWPRRNPHKVKLALENSFMVTALYRQTLSEPGGSVECEDLIGCIRVTSDTVFNATLWDVTVDPAYQGEGLGKTLMEMTIRKLCRLDIRTISLFAEPQVLEFYRKLGFRKDPQGIKAMFW